MHCPFCGCEETQVKDSRPSEDGTSIRRRRACPECGARFTTFERIQLRELTVIKARDKRQPFDRDKIIKSMEVALRKRPVTEEHVERAVNGVVRQLEVAGETEVTSRQIGALVMQALMGLDVIGYIRYASVYKDFSTPEDFKDFVKTLDQLI
ncbi:MAG: transcriptional regulator NrdR [Alphaproteobacteria bacterium]|jgi:transcriptional repressor NrdR|nr:transcriptional regulator NrdR [Alphaproteobacteria bacterium]